MKEVIKCKVCQSETRQESITKHNFIYHFCDKCKYISLDEKFYLDASAEKERYDNHNNSIEDDGYVNMFESFLDTFIDNVDKKSKVLDFGCGPGPVLVELLERRGFEVSKYDPNFYNDKTVFENRYSLITSTEVIEHVSNPIEFLNSLKKILEKDGYIALMTKFHNDDLEHFKNWWYRRDPTHIGFFRKETFEYMADILNLKIVYCDDKDIIVLKRLDD